jgi:hypothetical protein
MAEALRFFRDYEIWIYLIAAALAIWQIGKFAWAWRDFRSAGFGLERELAQVRLNGAATMLVLLVAATVVEFALVSFIIPFVPSAVALPTPTLNLLATRSITLAPQSLATGTASPVGTLPQSAGGPTGQSTCIPGQVELTSPKDGEEVTDVVTLIGTVDIPNLGFYKYELAHPGDPAWLTVGGGRDKVVKGKLGEWDSTTRTPGEYLLRLVVANSEGEYLPACVIRVRVAPSSTP